MRLFVAAELPAEVAAAVAERAGEARDRLPPASWVRRENLHLTLAFLGDVDEPTATALELALADSVGTLPPIAARIEGAGCFPPRGPARVAWLGLAPEAALAALAGRVREAVRAAGATCDEKPFRSHVTVARCRRPWPPPARSLWEKSAPQPPLELEVAAVAVVASELAPGGSRYTTRARVPLGGSR